MTFGQVKSFYESKKDSPCSVTTNLIKASFHLRYGAGYLSGVQSGGEIPIQWLHLMTYCDGKDANRASPYTPCGELVFRPPVTV